MRFRFIARSSIAVLSCFLAAAVIAQTTPDDDDESPRPNILFIVADDWNDWNSVLKGYPQAHTPNLERLAVRSVTFTRAYASSPVCNPSRTAVMFGRRASSTGVYNNEQFMRDSPVLRDADTIPQHFRNHGYHAFTAGKIFHWYRNAASDPQSWDEQLDYEFWAPRLPRTEAWPFNFGPLDIPDAEMPDRHVVDWIAGKLQHENERPFFAAAGIFRPHSPWTAPRKYFDRYPLDQIQLPVINPADLEDIPAIARMIDTRARDDFARHRAHGAWDDVVQAYLASVSFADACLGVLLDAIEASPHADNTIILFWSDHGYQFGEKLSMHKWKLWEESIRSNLMIAVPGNPHNGTTCDRPVSLLDIYPTLAELAGLPAKPELEGRSLAPLVDDPSQEWEHPVLINRDRSQHGVRSDRFNYIRYEDGSEELYDHTHDPAEWTNLANDPVYAPVLKELRDHLPTFEHPHIPEDFDSHM